MQNEKPLDLRNRTQLETAIFLICQHKSLELHGDFFPESEEYKLVNRLVNASVTELFGIFEGQMNESAAFDYFKKYGFQNFIAPNGDVYNLMDGEWYVTVK